jgi:hypothetical protein
LSLAPNRRGTNEECSGHTPSLQPRSSLFLTQPEDCEADALLREETLIVLHGFIKKTQKTPADEFTLAKRRMNEMKKQNKNVGSLLERRNPIEIVKIDNITRRWSPRSIDVTLGRRSRSYPVRPHGTKPLNF